MPTLCLAEMTGLSKISTGEVRYLGLFKVYDASLYVKTGVQKKDILKPKTSRCLKLEYSMSLSIDDIIIGEEAVLKRQHSKDKVERYKEEIEKMHVVYREVKKGDNYTLCYTAEDMTTTLSLNDEKLVSVSSEGFGEFYFGIWLGPIKPLDVKLRRTLME